VLRDGVRLDLDKGRPVRAVSRVHVLGAGRDQPGRTDANRLERQDIQLAYDALRFGALLLVFLAAYQLAWSPLLTIAVLSTGTAICHIMLFVRTRQVLLAHLGARA
jgi:hypothetical protein